MALFPTSVTDAVNSSISILDKVREYNYHRNKSGYPPISIGIGIHSGKLMLGTVGEHERMDVSVISDDVNLAMRTVGKVGSGKTTVINLLERFYDPGQGVISVDGVDLRQLDPAWLRQQIGLVMQDVYIAPDTMRENILLGLEMSEEDLGRIIEQAARLNGC